MITQPEARAYAITVLRKRMAHDRFNRSRLATSVEGAGGPGEPGWMVRSGTMYVPGYFRPEVHCFRLADLFAEIDSPQPGLFA